MNDGINGDGNSNKMHDGGGNDVVGDKEGNGKRGKSHDDGNKEGIGNGGKGNGHGNKEGKSNGQRGQW